MYLKTAESVTEGHPDKVCDQISDAILDACLRQDPNSRVAVETFGAHGLLVIGGEVTSEANFNPEQIAREVYKKIGYNDELEVISHIVQQSPEIGRGVDFGGAGDQGIMYGYATMETGEYLPKSIILAHNLARRLAYLRRNDPEFFWLRPDGKTQATFADGKIKTVLVSTQHEDNMSQGDIREKLIKGLIEPLVGDLSEIEILINPSGSFVTGGFMADTGLTGRKIMVDTYGGLLPHGGGAFSGKDPSKVDRSAAYMCRFAAKNIVASGLAKSCLVSVAYAIGKEDPLMLVAKTSGGQDLTEVLKKNFDFRPRAIIERLGLRRPIYQPTAAYGHFTNAAYPWEEIVGLK
ncbi:MAG: methionine adenosyltransferase [Patescibacteria group bacterium]|nr:methionine adenosyltransferase [Patescibacteria group bacterium]MDD5490363.1 methionine adenosyltransferase [Patescibacteria group bacterium]